MKNPNLQEIVERCKRSETDRKNCFLNDYAAKRQAYCEYRKEDGTCFKMEKQVASYLMNGFCPP